MYVILNLMNNQDLSLERVVSILGYSLVPIVLLSALAVLVDMSRGFGLYLALCVILWSTVAATRYLDVSLNMHDRRFLIAYPIGLLYTSFTFITIF